MALAHILAVRSFTVEEKLLMGIVIAFGIAFFTWLVAGYYERRGGMGKK